MKNRTCKSHVSFKTNTKKYIYALPAETRMARLLRKEVGAALNSLRHVTLSDGNSCRLAFSLSLCCRSLPIATFVREISSVSSSCNNRSFAVQLQVWNRHGWMSMYKSLIDKRQRGRKKRICTRHHIGQTDYSDNCNEISIQNSGSVSIHEFHIKLSSVLLTSTFHGIVGPSVSIVAKLVALGPFQHDSFKPFFFSRYLSYLDLGR